MIMKKCPNCNAPLVYQESRRVYVCQYCKAEFMDENRRQETTEQTEKKVIYEYHHINVPAEQTPTKAIEEKKNSGRSRGVLIGFGIFFLLGAVTGFNNSSSVGGAFACLIIGFFLLIMGSRKNK